MSADSNSSQASDDAGANSTAEAGAQTDAHVTDAHVIELQLPSDSIGLELVRLLAETHPSDLAVDAADSIMGAPVYDGHVALTLDTDVLPNIDATLDMLTSSAQLFDVPALDVANVIDDSMPS